MPARIYYFSASGNSLAIARRIAKSLEKCELIPIAKAIKDPDLLDCKNGICGFVVPNYYLGLPKIVAEFISQAYFNAAQYIFMIVTSGHDLGRVIGEADQILKNKGQRISYGCYLVMPDNYLPVYNVPPERAKIILLKAQAELENVIKDIAESKKGIKENTYFLGSMMKSWHKYWVGTFAMNDKKFIVDDTCNYCGICERVCPVNNIARSSGKPVWQHRCEQCYACMHLCPQVAIQYGESTRNKNRYHHPDITASDIAKQRE